MRSTTAVSPSGRSIFGRCLVIGHSRVAYPPARTTASTVQITANGTSVVVVATAVRPGGTLETPENCVRLAVELLAILAVLRAVPADGFHGSGSKPFTGIDGRGFRRPVDVRTPDYRCGHD
ncbi:hypothetical protein C492_09645 [Natronococcus jeotgali DSM 18795]|uniref:Uncharacterized protein n=1 Tax=Natronococcus jeotgali DSM 18795 TaxID=1227498 RepID=L9XH20_9EURY|nr:hypothetical protein C492_09645 [Natronococcus jeotgali DSM 18795]